MKQILTALLILVCITSCQLQPTRTMLPQNIGAYSFSEIVLQGDTKVELLNGYDNLQMDSTIKPIVSLDKKILTINTPRIKNNPLTQKTGTIKIFNKKIRKITVTDNSSVYAQNLKTPGLTIIAKQNGCINLEGNYCIDAIYQNGRGAINIGWVNSKNLFVSSNNNGPIHLYGVADKMIAKLTNNAQLDAQYLRVNQAEIFATDSATAEVLALDYLGGYAVDRSNIRYYKNSNKITIVSKDCGNVIKSGSIR